MLDTSKKMGKFFKDTIIAIRLHSSQGIICEFEKNYHAQSYDHLLQFDLERKSLQDCDIVVGHQEKIAEYNKTFYGFNEEWLSKVVINFPPIFISSEEIEDKNLSVVPHEYTAEDKDILFSTRLQPFKQPHLFIQGMILFFRMNPDYSGRAIIASYGWDKKYISWLFSIIPQSFSGKFLVFENLSPGERLSLIKRSIFVISSNYESLCVAAFEAIAAGATVVLNESCLAFSTQRRFLPGENCLMFDGSPMGLANIIKQANEFVPSKTIDTHHDKPYWISWASEHLPVKAVESEAETSNGLLLIVFSSSLIKLLRLLETVPSDSYVEIFVFNSGPQTFSIDMPCRITVIEDVYKGSRVSLLHDYLPKSTCNAIAIVDDCCVFRSNNLSEAINVLPTMPDDGIMFSCSHFLTKEAYDRSEPCSVIPGLGDCLLSAINCFNSFSVNGIFKKHIFLDFIDDMMFLDDWYFLNIARKIISGRRIAASPFPLWDKISDTTPTVSEHDRKKLVNALARISDISMRSFPYAQYLV